MSITTLGTAAYNTAKEIALATELIRKEISLSEFNVVNETTIEIDGKEITVSKKAFSKILTRLRIPKAFADRFRKGFGDNALKELIRMMKANRSDANDTTVTLLVDPREKEIIDVLPAKYASISNKSFISFIEEYIHKYDLGVTQFGSNSINGTIINTVAPNSVFRVPGIKDEVFNTGVTFRNTPSNGLEVTPHLNRLVCTNGMSSTSFAETFGLHQFTDANISEFNDHMISMAAVGFQPVGLKDKIEKAVNTDASLSELQYAASRLLSTSKKVDWNYIQRYAPIDRANIAYQNCGIDTAALTKNQLANAKCGMSIWDVVNGMTNFASNENRFDIGDHARANLMIDAGNLLMKKQYDTEALCQVDPFANRDLLSQKEKQLVRGEV